MSDIALLRSLVDGYRLEVNGARFWTPYWVNDLSLMAGTGAPRVIGSYKGKGTPLQIRSALIRQLKSAVIHPKTARDYLQMMRSSGLGVDCSGFVYHVLDGYLRARAQGSLAEQLVVDRGDLLTAYEQNPSWRQPSISREKIMGYAELVPLDEVCRLFRKSPRMLTNVARLCDPLSNRRVQRADDIRPADLIKMSTQRWGDHVGIVVEATPGRIVFAQSTEPPESLGGVGYADIVITNPDKDLGIQDWKQRAAYHPDRGSDGVWRLKVLADG